MSSLWKPFLLAALATAIGSTRAADSLPGFVPPQASALHIPTLTGPATLEAMYRFLDERGYGAVSEELFHEAITGSGSLLFSERAAGAELPHATWAKPAAGGPLKVLYICETSDSREPVEIAQRLEGEVFTSYFVSGKLNAGDTEVFTRIHLDRLKRADPTVVVLGDPYTHAGMVLPPAVLQELRRRVEEGMGLVLFTTIRHGPKEKVERDAAVWTIPFLADFGTGWANATVDWQPGGSNPYLWQPLPAGGLEKLLLPPLLWVQDGWQVAATVAGKPWILTRELGKGRMVLVLSGDGAPLPSVQADSNRPGRENRRVDDQCTPVLRSLFWAARRETSPRWKIALPENGSAQVSSDVTVSLDEGSAVVAAEFSVRNSDYQLRWSDTLRLGKNPLTATARIPALRINDTYFLDVVLRDGQGRSLDWASRAIRVTDGPCLALALTKEVWRAGETLAGELRLATPLAAGQKVELVAELWDRFGRILARQTSGARPALGDTASLTVALPLAGTRERVLMVVGRAVADGVDVARTEAEVFLPRFGLDDDFCLMSWAPVLRLRHSLHLAQCRELGFDASSMGPWGPKTREADQSAWAGLGVFLENGNHLATCLSDKNFAGEPEFDKYFPEVIQPMGEKLLRRYGCMLLSMSNEATFYKGVAADKRVITENQKKQFREFLRRDYGTVEALNREWGRSFAGFDAVEPVGYVAKPDGMNLAPWVDWDRFLEHTSVAQQVRAKDIYFRAMHGECLWGSTSGSNTESQFAAGARLYGNTMGDGRHFLGTQYEPGWYDLTRGGTAFGWMGYSYPEWAYEFFIWHNLLHGSKTDAIFTSGNLAPAAGVWTQRADWTRKHQEAIHSGGIGRLLAGSERRNDPVAILHSDISKRVIEHFARQQSEDRLAGQFYSRFAAASNRSMMQLLVDAQLHPTYVTEADVAAGALAGMKMLVLSCTVALAPETAQAIRQFAEQGGLVIADLTPGIFDGHGRLLEAGVLDDFFGFRREALKLTAYPAEYTLGITAETKSPYFLPKEWLFVELREDAIKATDGKALGTHIVGHEPPAFIFRQHGKGASLYLNYLDTQYKESRNPRHLTVMRALLKWAGVAPRVQVTDANGDPLPLFDVTYLEDDQAMHVGLNRDQRENRQGDEVVLHFPRAGFAYDVRDGVYLGEGPVVRATVPQFRQKLITLLPCRIDDVTLALKSSVRRGESLAWAVKPKMAGPGTSLVYRLRLLGPDGKEQPAFSSTLRSPQGKAAATGQLALALNDPTGKWTLQVTEAVSGKTATAQFVVK